MTDADLFRTLEATWPPSSRRALGPFTLRDGAGGGKRVSAATADAPFADHDLTAAEARFRDTGQSPLFLIRGAHDGLLDDALAARGYRVIDPVVAYAIAANALPEAPVMTTFPHWPPLEVGIALWDAAGITAPRVAVMQRAAGPKTVILARTGDRVTGVAFIALHQRCAMLHALEVAPDHRRKGAARHMLCAAARWTVAMGGDTLSLVVTTANAPARALYETVGMQSVTRYHYRVRHDAHAG